jgi:hypothetical protein
MAGAFEIVRSPEEVRKIYDLLMWVTVACEPLFRRLEPGPHRVLTEVIGDAVLLMGVMRWLLGEPSEFEHDLERFEALAHSLKRYTQEAIH